MGRQTEPAVRNPGFQLDHCRVKTPWIGNPQHDTGALDRRERLLGALDVKGKRLFHKDMLAAGGSAFDLAAVLAMRRRKYDGVDLWVGQDFVEIIEFEGFNPLKAELEGFAAAINGVRPYPITADEIVHGVAAFEAIVRSAATGQPVKVAKRH